MNMTIPEQTRGEVRLAPGSNPEDARRWRLPPPVTTFAVLAVVIGAYLLIGVRESPDANNDAFVSSVPWQVWKLTAAVAVAAWVVVLLAGARRLRDLDDLGLRHIRPDTLIAYLAAALLTALAVLTFLFLTNAEPPFKIPVPRFPLRSRALVAAASICAVPWIALVWLCHREVRALEEPINDLTVDDADPVTDDSGALLDNLVRLWGLVSDCVGALAIFVVTSLITSGALRAAFASQFTEGDERLLDFPTSYVLLYGLFFTVIMTVIALPLVSAWRQRARQLVDRLYSTPPDGRIPEEWASGRTRLQAYLGLDVSLLRNPLTALSVLLPLITAALATFVPELGG